MEHCSTEESDVSDSDIGEHEEKTYTELRAGKLKVKHGEKMFRCPFCLGKKKQDYHVKDLLQHASGIGAASKRNAKVKATHLALARYLKNDLASSLDSSMQLVVYQPKPTMNEEKLVWPWMGVLVVVPTEFKDENFVRESEDRLRAQFSRFRPLQVTALWNTEGQTDYAIVKFAKDWTGLKDSLAFENHFTVEQYARDDWNKRNCRRDDFYGWLARSDDYDSPGPIGEYLRKNGYLKSVGDLEREELCEKDRRVATLSHQIEETNKHLEELVVKNNKNTMMLDRMIEEEYRLVEEHNKKIKKMQKVASKNSRKILDENMRLHSELQTRREEIDQRCKLLKDMAKKANVDRGKLEVEKKKNAKENELLNIATQMKKKADKELLLLVEKQKKEKEDALRKQYDLEKQLDSKQKLELEIEQLRGRLEVMKHMDSEEGTKLKEINELCKKLKDKDEEMEDLESLNSYLIIKDRRTNEELESARKELILGLQKISGGRCHIGVKRMGELDKKAFHNACKEEDDFKVKVALHCSKWEDEISKPDWHPFKIVNAHGQTKEIINEDDEKLHDLRVDLGDEAYNAVVKALLEMNEYNPSARYPVPELWNSKENRKASIPEVVDYLLKQWKTHKNKRNYT